LLALALPASAGVNVAGGLTFTGERVAYSVTASYPLLTKPEVNLKLLWEPERAEVAGALSTPVSTFCDPLTRWLKLNPSPWIMELAQKVEVGGAFWATQEKFPVNGGLFWCVDALSFAF